MAQPDTTPTTLTLTHRERVLLACAILKSYADADAPVDDLPDLLSLWERIQPDEDAF